MYNPLPLFSGMFNEYGGIQFMAWDCVSSRIHSLQLCCKAESFGRKFWKLLFSPIIAIGVFGYCMANVEMIMLIQG